MDGSTFKGRLEMDSVSVGGDLFMMNAEFDKVNLRGAKISNQLVTVESTFKGELNINSASVGISLFMRNAEFDEVDLRGAKISRSLDMEDAIFKGQLEMDSVSVGRDLFMMNAEFSGVHLLGARIGDQLSMSGSTFKGKLEMDSASVGRDLFMREVKLYKPAYLVFLSVGSNLYVQSATLRSLDLAGSRIKGELWIGSANWPDIEWESYKDENKNSHAPKLTLRNTSVGTLQDTRSTWPAYLEREFDGFTYDRLSVFGEREAAGLSSGLLRTSPIRLSPTGTWPMSSAPPGTKIWRTIFSLPAVIAN